MMAVGQQPENICAVLWEVHVKHVQVGQKQNLLANNQFLRLHAFGLWPWAKKKSLLFNSDLKIFSLNLNGKLKITTEQEFSPSKCYYYTACVFFN